MFSSRIPASLTPNRLTTALERFRSRGRQVLDLTVTNPTAVGVPYPADLLAALASPDASTYAPEPLGSVLAREHLAAVLSEETGRAPRVDRLALTASTSEAYAVLFKLLCDPGDEILVPRPSYPLFEHLASLESVVVVPYPLEGHAGWTIDLGAVDAAWGPRTRAVVVVSPNNPTGSMLRARELRQLQDWCAERRAALVVDEVFRWYPLGPAADAVCAALAGSDPPALVFTLDGLSKSCGLPQVKLAWIEMAGPGPLVAEARRRLEMVLDTYLSVSTPVQVALPHLWRHAAAVRQAIRERLRRNLEAARHIVSGGSGCSLVEPEGGWSAVMRVPALVPEETRVLDLLEREGVLVHPGYYFDFPHEAFLVFSLLPRSGEFDDGLSRVVRRCGIA